MSDASNQPTYSAAVNTPLCHRPDDEYVVQKIEDLAFAFLHNIKNETSPLLHLQQVEGGARTRWSRATAKRISRVLNLLSDVHTLVLNNQFNTKREMFYQNVGVYGKQGKLDSSIAAAGRLLMERRYDLHISATAKGSILGRLRFGASNDRVFDCSQAPMLIGDFAHHAHSFSTDAKFVLIVEKDAVMQSLYHNNWLQHWPDGILITGRGYPDLCTRVLLKRINKQLELPIFVLVDADPHGMEIFTVYKYGTKKVSHDTLHLELPDCQLLGLLRTDVNELPIAKDQHTRLSHTELNKLKKLMRREDVQQDKPLMRQLTALETSGTKLEIEAISQLSASYFIETYLREKIVL